MIDTILLFTLVLVFIAFLLFAFIKRKKFSRAGIILPVIIGLVFIIPLFLYTGAKKIRSDLSRLIQNSGPKKPKEVYALLFKKPIDSCLTVVNFQDQVIPRIDCCIWMEVKICPTELARIISLKKYDVTRLNRNDSIGFLSRFGDRPTWWTPQTLGGDLTKMFFKFSQDNEQTLFFGEDSSHVYLCDQAL